MGYIIFYKLIKIRIKTSFLLFNHTWVDNQTSDKLKEHNILLQNITESINHVMFWTYTTYTELRYRRSIKDY